MAVKLLRKRVCAAKIEAVSGTAEALAAADGAENFFNPVYEGEIPVFERQGQGSPSRIAGVPGAQGAKFSFQTHLYNAASAPLWMATLLVGCGFALSTGVYVPSFGSAVTLTLGQYNDGNLYSLFGAQGNVKITADKVGEPIKMNWEFMGRYQAPTATAIIAPTYPTTKPVRFAAATLSLGAISMVVKKFEIDMGNKVVLREDAAQAQGYITALITDRQPKMTMTVEVPAIGTHDYYNDLTTSAENAFSCAVGSGTNGIITIAAPKLQLLSAPKLSDADGILTYDLEFALNRSAAAGDDEISITPS